MPGRVLRNAMMSWYSGLLSLTSDLSITIIVRYLFKPIHKQGVILATVSP